MVFSALRVTAVSLCSLPWAEEASVWADLTRLLPLPECPRVLTAPTVFQSLGMTRDERAQNSR